MRIIAGEFRSRKLMAPDTGATRPTSDRARESLFNALTHLKSFDGANVLDLFAGSGALGFEAMSRGAVRVTFVEHQLAAKRMIDRNALALGAQSRVHCVRQDAQEFLMGAATQYDFILADPPYDALNESAQAMSRVFEHAWLAPDGLMAVEHRTGQRPVVSQHAEEVRSLTVGEASFLILRHRQTP
jgi:16S rRNA (guanine966-N2)-methyltransferase